MEETWWWRKITNPLDEPPISQVWLQMIITWSIFITLSPLFFHNDLEDVKFMHYFMCKVRKWMEVVLRIQKIIGHFMIFCQLQQFITLSNFWRFLMVQVPKCHSRGLFNAIIFGQEKNPSGRPCLDVRHYRSLLKEKLRKVNLFFSTLTHRNS